MKDGCRMIAAAVFRVFGAPWVGARLSFVLSWFRVFGAPWGSAGSRFRVMRR